MPSWQTTLSNSFRRRPKDVGPRSDISELRQQFEHLFLKFGSPPSDAVFEPAGRSPGAPLPTGQANFATTGYYSGTKTRTLQPQIVDAGLRGSKALEMLKAERFQLFSQLEEKGLVGVVKSQSDPTLVYSCRLTADGSFSCCTQNLNVCGGLRGALCKHLLVLIVGLTRSGQLDPTVIDQWVQASKQKRPVLDKDAASAVFLRYKGAEAGEVDWRPTETIPEDFYAF